VGESSEVLFPMIARRTTTAKIATTTPMIVPSAE
jgi:hypothetical protein